MFVNKIQNFAFMAQFVPKLRGPVIVKSEHKNFVYFVNKKINI